MIDIFGGWGPLQRMMEMGRGDVGHFIGRLIHIMRKFDDFFVRGVELMSTGSEKGVPVLGEFPLC